MARLFDEKKYIELMRNRDMVIPGANGIVKDFIDSECARNRREGARKSSQTAFDMVFKMKHCSQTCDVIKIEDSLKKEMSNG